MNIVIKICSIIGTTITVLMAYRVIFVLVGLFKTRKFEKAKTNHTYGICIAARNEEKVILNLLESLLKQDYPQENLRVFVVADNCTDQTATKCRDFGLFHPEMNITVYEHNNPDERTKGYALKYLFEQIKTDFNISAFEGYFIFDADNVLKPDYISRMNEAFDSGCKIITSYRHSKNFSQNWISFQYAMHWIRTCFAENRAKSVLNQACRIQGTGILFASEVVRDGWKYVRLTEDRSFCSDAVVQGYRISYCEAAQFYDEQPYKLRVAFRQRIRWAKGHLQSLAENGPGLLRNIFKFNKDFCPSYDMFWINFPRQIESGFRKIVVFAMRMAICLTTYSAQGGGGIWLFWKSYLISYLITYAVNWLLSMLSVAFIMIFYRKRIGKQPFFKTLFHIFMFPIFDKIGKWSCYIALFSHVEWKVIPHDQVVDVDKFIEKVSDKNS